MNISSSKEKTKRLAVMAMLTAMVVVLQIVGSYVKFGRFSITPALIPIVVGGILLGPKHGTALGGIFGIIVFIFCVSGVDAGGNMLFLQNPFLTAFVCVVKGAAAGLAPALIYKALNKKNFHLAVLLASAAAPIVNTGLFIAGLSSFFYDTMVAWAGGSDILFYVITGLVGINFIIEFAVNVALSAAVAAIVRAFSSSSKSR